MRSLGTGDDLTEEWLEVLRGGSLHGVESRLLESRGSLGSWWLVAERLRPVVGAIAARRATGTLSPLGAQLASERLARGLIRLADALPVHPTMARCLITSASSDSDVVEAALAEICLREAGWHTFTAVPGTRFDGLEEVLETHDFRLVVVTASAALEDASELKTEATEVALTCERKGVATVFSGAGAWPEQTPPARVVHGFEAFHSAALELLPKDLMQ